MIRRNFFDLIEADLEGYLDEPDRLQEAAPEHPCFLRFRHSSITQRMPEFLDDAVEVRRAFTGRVARSLKLFARYGERGLAPRVGIALDPGAEIHSTASGERPTQRLLAGDGCHRLALKLRAGQEILAPNIYRGRIFRSYTPRDVSRALPPELDLSPNEYFSFLSLAYSDREFLNAASLHAYIERTHPDRLDEVESIIAADAVAVTAP